LRKLWILVVAAAIFGGMALFEIYVSLLYPVTSYVPKGLPTLAVGVEHGYDFFKDGELVGSYVFWVERIAPYKGQTAYFTRSTTSVAYHETVIELETVYIFNENLNPLKYRLNATLSDDRQSIICLFEGWTVNTSLKMEEGGMEKVLEFPVNTVLVDNNMLGQWELLFKSFDLIPGKRVRVNIFIPQALDMRSMDLVVDRGKKTLKLNDIAFECQVVRAPDLNLFFYIHEGDLLKLEESVQNISISRSP